MKEAVNLNTRAANGQVRNDVFPLTMERGVRGRRKRIRTADGGSRAGGALSSLLGTALRFGTQSRHTIHDAQDLTQSFSPTCLNIRSTPAPIDRKAGSVTSLASLKNFLADAADRERNLKRGGAQIFLPLHEEQAQEAGVAFQTDSGMSNEDRLFDRSWAEALVPRRWNGCRRITNVRAKGQLQGVRMFVAGGAVTSPTYAELADRLGIAESTLRSHVIVFGRVIGKHARGGAPNGGQRKAGRSRVARVAGRINGIVRNARHGQTLEVGRLGLLDVRQAVERKRRLPGLPAADGFVETVIETKWLF